VTLLSPIFGGLRHAKSCIMLAIKFCKCRGNTADLLYEMSVYRYYHHDIALCVKRFFILSVWFEHGTRVGELVCSLKDLSWTQTHVILFHHIYYHYYQPLQAKYKDYKLTSSTTRNVPLLTLKHPA